MKKEVVKVIVRRKGERLGGGQEGKRVSEGGKVRVSEGGWGAFGSEGEGGSVGETEEERVRVRERRWR